jgi:hypothetical protein
MQKCDDVHAGMYLGLDGLLTMKSLQLLNRKKKAATTANGTTRAVYLAAGERQSENDSQKLCSIGILFFERIPLNVLITDWTSLGMVHEGEGYLRCLECRYSHSHCHVHHYGTQHSAVPSVDCFVRHFSNKSNDENARDAAPRRWNVTLHIGSSLILVIGVVVLRHVNVL